MKLNLHPPGAADLGDRPAGPATYVFPFSSQLCTFPSPLLSAVHVHAAFASFLTPYWSDMSYSELRKGRWAVSRQAPYQAGSRQVGEPWNVWRRCVDPGSRRSDLDEGRLHRSGEPQHTAALVGGTVLSCESWAANEM